MFSQRNVCSWDGRLYASFDGNHSSFVPLWQCCLFGNLGIGMRGMGSCLRPPTNQIHLEATNPNWDTLETVGITPTQKENKVFIFQFRFLSAIRDLLRATGFKQMFLASTGPPALSRLLSHKWNWNCQAAPQGNSNAAVHQSESETWKVEAKMWECEGDALDRESDAATWKQSNALFRSTPCLTWWGLDGAMS